MNPSQNKSHDGSNHSKPKQGKGLDGMSQDQVKPTAEQAQSKPSDSGDAKENHMMRSALRALFAVGVVMVLFRISRRTARRGK